MLLVFIFIVTEWECILVKQIPIKVMNIRLRQQLQSKLLHSWMFCPSKGRFINDLMQSEGWVGVHTFVTLCMKV